MPLAEFDECRFPHKIAFGFSGGDIWATTITRTKAGFEQRNVDWSQSLRRYEMEHELKNQTELDELINFFNARRGQAVGFRLIDWRDYASDMVAQVTALSGSSPPALDELPATGIYTPQNMINTVTGTFGADGSTTIFQLAKTYPAVTAGLDYIKEIKKPVPGAVRIFDAAVEQTEGVDYTLDDTTGLATFSVAPTNLNAITADFLYDIPVRFDTDIFSSQLDHFNISNWRGITMVEIRIP